jgi:hypothetical protein
MDKTGSGKIRGNISMVFLKSLIFIDIPGRLVHNIALNISPYCIVFRSHYESRTSNNG